MQTLKRKVSWTTFQKSYLTKENKFKYEWLNGTVEKSLRTWIPTHFSIQARLQNLCNQANTTNQVKGRLIANGDAFFGTHHRQPDFAYYTRAQMLAASKNKNVIPEFVIEIISPSDNAYKVNQKVIDYRNAGVKIIWHLFPQVQEVHIYRDNALKMEIKREKDICSAEPVIKGFNISVLDIFKA